MGIPAPLGVGASGQPPAGDQANAVVTGTFTAIGPGKAFAFRGPINLAIWASVATALTTTAGSLSATVASDTGLAVGASINSVNVPRGTTIGTLPGANALTLKVPPITLYGSVTAGFNAITDLPSTDGLVGATITSPRFAAGTTVVVVTRAAVAPSANSPGVLGIVQTSAPALTASALRGVEPFDFVRTANAITVTGADANSTFAGGPMLYVGTIQLERSFDGGATWLPCNIGGAGALAQYAAGTPVNLIFGEAERSVLYRLNCLAYTSGTINYRISETGAAAEALAIGQLVN